MRNLANIFRYVLLMILHGIYFVLHFFIQKNNNTLLFFSTGHTFTDNLGLFHDFVLKMDNAEAIILVRNKSLYNNLKLEFPNVFLMNSFMGLFQFLKHKKIIIDNGDARLFFFPYYLHPNYQLIINLWHGIPLKKLGRSVVKRNEESLEIQFQTYSYFTVSSEFEKKLIHSCYTVTEDIWVTGSPRNDELTKNNFALLQDYPFLNKKTILYAPTWREQGNKSAFFPFKDKDLVKLNKFLENQDAYLLLRGHREEMKYLSDKNPMNFTRILAAHQDVFSEVQHLLPYVDVLLTDYSSIYLDYLLLNKPIIFMPYDIKEYTKYRGFLFDYYKYSPGPKVNSQEDLIRELETSLNKPNNDASYRSEISDVFHKFKNGGACHRIYDEIKKLN